MSRSIGRRMKGLTGPRCLQRCNGLPRLIFEQARQDSNLQPPILEPAPDNTGVAGFVDFQRLSFGRGWSSKRNSELLRLMLMGGFHIPRLRLPHHNRTIVPA